MVGRAFSYVSSGLTAGSTYYWRVTCGPLGGLARRMGVVTTLSTGGAAATSTLRLIPPPGRGVTTAVVDYGSTEALGSSTNVSCASGCTANLPGSANRALYYRVTYRDAAAATVAVSRILPMIQ